MSPSQTKRSAWVLPGLTTGCEDPMSPVLAAVDEVHQELLQSFGTLHEESV